MARERFGGLWVVFFGVLGAGAACGRVETDAPDGPGGAGSATASAGSVASGGTSAGAPGVGGSLVVGGTGGAAIAGGGTGDEAGLGAAFNVDAQGGAAGEGGDAGAIGDADYEHPLWRMPNAADSGLPNPVSYSTSQSQVVTDRVTGLMWQAATALEPVDWNGAVNYCKGQSLQGYADWRLPSRIELVSLFASGQDWINGNAAFPFDPHAQWSSSPSTQGPTVVWIVNPSTLSIDVNDEAGKFDVRCVRSTTRPRPRRFSHVLGADTVTDTATGLVWQRTQNFGFGTFDQAMQYCGALNLAGRDGWRVPSLQELDTLIDDGYNHPALIPSDFQDTELLINSWLWSSTLYIPADPNHANAPALRFIDGRVQSQPEAEPLSARCVH